MVKRVIIALLITGFTAAMCFAEPAETPAGPKLEAPRAAGGDKTAQHDKWLKQLREAYQQNDMEKMGKVLDKMEKHRDQVRSGNLDRGRSFGPGRGKMGRGQRQGRKPQGRKPQVGRMRGECFGQGPAQGKMWKGRGFQKPFAGQMRGRGFGQGPQAGLGRQMMGRPFARQRLGQKGHGFAQAQGGFGQGFGRQFGRQGHQGDMRRAGPQQRCPGCCRGHRQGKMPMQRQGQKQRSQWDW